MYRFGLFVSLLFFATLPACQEEIGPDGGCFERRTDEEFGNPSIQYTCEENRPCDGLNLLCPGSDEAVDCGPSQAIVENPEALECMLDALVDGEDAQISWGLTAADDRGWAGRSHRLWIRGGRAYYASRYSVDLDTEVDGVRYVKLRSKADFEACRDTTSNATRLDCVMNAWTRVIGVVIEPS